MEFGARPPLERLQALRDALSHRGPDDSGIEVVENVGLVHTRLAILDVGPSAHQPMRHPGGRFWLVYNGEVYNHRELRAGFEPGDFSGHGDTESIMWALQRSGLEAVAGFSGQFALAALDLDSRRLLLCRDRFGVKPLYLASFGGGVWFASEPAALISAGAPARPVDAAFGAILVGSRYGGSETLLDGILRLGPGAWASILLDGGQVTSGRWFAPSGEVSRDLSEQLARCSRRQLAAELKRTLRSAVHSTLMADVPVGALLSGGVDSSLLVAFAAEERSDLVAFAANQADNARYGEAGSARRVAAHLGVELDVTEVTPASWRGAFVAATIHSGGPLTNASAVTVAQLAERAQAAGVKVLLTGEGADELFGGYGDLHAERFGAVLAPHHRLLQSLEQGLGERPRLLRDPHATARWLRDALSDAVRPRRSAVWTMLSMPLGGPDLMYEALLAYEHHPPEVARAEAGLLARMDYTLCWLLNRMDKNLMQHAIEGRVPFLEPEVVRLAVNLPLVQRIAPLSKGILRDVAASVLPAKVAYRPKLAGMDFDAGDWIEQAADPTFLADGVLRDVLRVPSGEWGRVMAAGNGHLRTRIWSAEVWCRSLFEGHTEAQIEQDLWRR